MGQMIWLIGWKKPKAVKDVKDSKLSKSETSWTFCEFEWRRNALSTSKTKTQFLKVKRLFTVFSPVKSVAHKNHDVINMTIWKQLF